jgi:hypothetical protein
MTCVRKGSLVEMVEDGHVSLKAIEHIVPGECVYDPVDGRSAVVITTLSQSTGGMWPVVQYMGLTSDLDQHILVPSRGWVCAGDVGTQGIQVCPQIYALVLSNGKRARVDGVVCDTHTPKHLTADISKSTDLWCAP